MKERKKLQRLHNGLLAAQHQTFRAASDVSVQFLVCSGTAGGAFSNPALQVVQVVHDKQPNAKTFSKSLSSPRFDKMRLCFRPGSMHPSSLPWSSGIDAEPPCFRQQPPKTQLSPLT